LVDDQKLDAVISMPSGVFKPYAGVSTSILLFTKTNSGGTDSVWFYDLQADGFSLDNKRVPLVAEGAAITPELDNIPDILARWDNLALERSKFDQSFMVAKADIVANGYDLSINRYKETIHHEEHYDAPQVILSRLMALEDEIQDELKELETMLAI
jgi:type I restriction enzyme M protein